LAAEARSAKAWPPKRRAKEAGLTDDQGKGADRRSGGDRRKVELGPPTPPGLERRKGERRTGRDRRKDR
jgi:hypothetical protein